MHREWFFPRRPSRRQPFGVQRREVRGLVAYHGLHKLCALTIVIIHRLCYLDFGMMSYAALNQRNGFLLAVVHIVNRDWAELVRVYRRLGFIPEGTDLKPIEVALENALPDVLNADISELNFKNVINKLGDVSATETLWTRQRSKILRWNAEC